MSGCITVLIVLAFIIYYGLPILATCLPVLLFLFLLAFAVSGLRVGTRVGG